MLQVLANLVQKVSALPTPTVQDNDAILPGLLQEISNCASTEDLVKRVGMAIQVETNWMEPPEELETKCDDNVYIIFVCT